MSRINQSTNAASKMKNRRSIFYFLLSTFSARGGYVALMSALIISAVVALVIITLGQVSYSGRANIAATHFKEKSRALAEACLNSALLKLAASSSYAGNETITVASDTCKIFTITSTSTGKVIQAQAQYQNSYTDYQIVVATSTASILDWQELQSF